MGDANREALLTALREQRRGQGRVEGVLVVDCPMTSCPVGEVSIHVRERAGGRLVQPKLKCPPAAGQKPCSCGSSEEDRMRLPEPFWEWWQRMMAETTPPPPRGTPEPSA